MNHKCTYCKHFLFHHPTFDDPSVWFQCKKGCFYTGTTKEELDVCNSENDCKAFDSKLNPTTLIDKEVASKARKVWLSFLWGVGKFIQTVFIIILLIVLLMFVMDMTHLYLSTSKPVIPSIDSGISK